MSLAVTLPDDLIAALAARVAELLAAEMARPTAEPWLDVEGAAAHLACPRSRVYALVSQRRIPHERDGSRLLFRASELDDWVRGGGARRA